MPDLRKIIEAKAAKCDLLISDEFDWLKHRYDYDATPHMSDGYVASEVRMLMRGQLNHEAVVTTAANRLSKLAIENAQLRAELAELRSCSSIKPKEFDLVKRTEWARLAHEAWGYIHTCHRKHGTDFEGRLHAINGLKEMARVLKETLPAKGTRNNG